MDAQWRVICKLTIKYVLSIICAELVEVQKDEEHSTLWV